MPRFKVFTKVQSFRKGSKFQHILKDFASAQRFHQDSIFAYSPFELKGSGVSEFLAL
jgi:hypothetical protein